MPKIDSYAAGMLPLDSRVVLIVSQGAAPTQPRTFVTVPSVVGRSQGAALDSFIKSQLQPQVVYDYHTFVRSGTVAAQYPEAAKSVPTGSQALAIVSSGEGPTAKQFVKLPTVVGQSETEAVGALTGAGLSPQVLYEYSPAVPAGVVTAQLPDPSTYTKRGARTGAATWLAIAVLAIALIVGAWYMFGGAGAGAQVVVPDVVGMSIEDATVQIEAAELLVGTVTEAQPTAEYTQPGTVLATNPEAQAEVAVGTIVDLVVVSGDESVIVPTLVGKSESDAVAQLGQLLLVPQVETREDAAAPGTVIDQSPVAGTPLPPGAVVRIVVSSGAATEEATVPSVQGLSRQAAEEALAAVGLSVSVTESPSDSVGAGMVITQSPVPGTVLPKGTRVLIVISKGTPASDDTVTLPNVVGDLLEDAEAQLEALGLVIRVYPSGGGGNVVAMSPSAGASVPVGSVVILTVE